uniref:Uncharacterized protein n=1 Tax=Romanomermis culicivorax TaxID=13658 RepID=A0A915L428_ROMCU
MAPPPRNPMPSTRLLVRLQNAGDHPSGAHLHMCSCHGLCTYNEASCQAQYPDSAGPSNATTTGTSHCYFCQTRVHPTDRCDRPCSHCQKICVHRATACPNRTPTLPGQGTNIGHPLGKIMRSAADIGTRRCSTSTRVYGRQNYRASPVDKILLDGEPSSPAVDAVHCAAEEA